MFGFMPPEVVGCPLEMILPNIYRTYQKKDLVEFLDNPNQNLQRHVSVFGKHKNGYVFPIKMRIRKISSFGQDAQFVVTIEAVYHKREKAHVLTDLKFRVVAVSEHANAYLGLNNKVIRHRRVYISTFCTDISESTIIGYLGRKDTVMSYHWPQYSDDEVEYYQILSPHYAKSGPARSSGVIDMPSGDNILPSSEELDIYKFFCEPVKYEESGIIGYSFTFSLRQSRVDRSEIEPEAKNDNFEFTFSPELFAYLRNHKERRNLRL